MVSLGKIGLQQQTFTYWYGYNNAEKLKYYFKWKCEGEVKCNRTWNVVVKEDMNLLYYNWLSSP